MPETESVPFSTEREFTDPNGVRYLLEIKGEAEIVRGPLGRFVDLAEQITAEGLDVPAELAAVLGLLQRPTPQAWADLVEGYRQMVGKVARVAALCAANDDDVLLRITQVLQALDEPDGGQ